MIEKLLTKEKVLLGVEVDNWEDAIRAAGKPLLDDGSIETSYIEGMIASVKEYGPYIVLDKGLALAHAAPTTGVNRIGLTVMTLKNPINFGNPDNDPVELILCLAAVDGTSHLEVISDLATLLSDRTKFDQLAHATSVDDVMSIIGSVK